MDIIKDTVKELNSLGIGGTLSDIVITRTYTGCWTLSYVRYGDGTIGCGIANNEMKVPDDTSFVRGLLELDAYDAISELDDREGSVFINSLLTSITSALSYKLMNDEEALSREGYSVITSIAPDMSAIMGLSRFVRETDVVAMVGFHVTLTPLVADIANKVNVTELMDLRDLEVTDFSMEKSNIEVFPAAQNRDVLGEADVVYITGETIVNNTIDELLEFSRKARIRIIYGPTSSFYHKVLFERGIDALSAIALPITPQFRRQFVHSRGWWQGMRGVKFLLIKKEG